VRPHESGCSRTVISVVHPQSPSPASVIPSATSPPVRQPWLFGGLEPALSRRSRCEAQSKIITPAARNPLITKSRDELIAPTPGPGAPSLDYAGVGLTPREREVLALMAEGLSNRGICGRLFLSPKTVEAHVKNIFMKLGLMPAPDDHRRVLAVLAFLRY
jgi:DNA-binding NarL/FixJ family response regulator